MIITKDRLLQSYKVFVIRADVDKDRSGGRNEEFTLRLIWVGGNQFDCTYQWKIFNANNELQSNKTYNFRASKIK